MAVQKKDKAVDMISKLPFIQNRRKTDFLDE